MDIEDLSKSQLLLLTILVNFVTSIATGVLTVSLLDQAPPTISQTINRIVDHTVETVATQTPVAGVVAKPAPIVKDEDRLTSAIAAEEARTVVIYAGATTTPPVAVGTYLPKARAVVTTTGIGMPTEAIILFPNKAEIPASVSHTSANITIYGFADAATLPSVAAPILLDHATLKQGQTVVALGSDGSAVTGIISKIDDMGVHTTLPAVPLGSAAVNLDGNVVGIAGDSAGMYFAADSITALLAGAAAASP